MGLVTKDAGDDDWHVNDDTSRIKCTNSATNTNPTTNTNKTRKSEDKLSLHHGCPESSGASERVARSLDGSCTCFEISL